MAPHEAATATTLAPAEGLRSVVADVSDPAGATRAWFDACIETGRHDSGEGP